MTAEPAEPAEVTPSPTGRWWRRNRWGVIGLPLALVAALVASSDRVEDYYWLAGLHDARPAEQGTWTTFHDTYHDAEGEHPFSVRLRLNGVHEVSTGWQPADPLDPPAGSTALAVDLSVAADPDVPLSGCSLALRGDDGTRYDYLPSIAGLSQPYSACVPPDRPGPLPDLGALDDEWGAQTVDRRPREWTVSPVLVVPEDVTITEVMLWWEKPVYASWTVD